MLKIARIASALALVAVLGGVATAQKHPELGRMWTFENAPLEWWEQEYGFKPSQEWLDQVRMSSLRYGEGCSASFVSPRGLIMTNHHCARGDVSNATPEGEDWLTPGFRASSLAEEVKLEGLTVQQLVSMKDITEAMNAGLAEAESDEAKAELLKANEDKIMAAAKEEHPNLTPQVVSLYQGGMYQLYMYRIFDDIRLVAVPEMKLAKFGGDPDNFTYPRFSLDYTFVRAYVDGKPADTSKHFFKWRTEGPNDGELTFVTGNPGSTGRLNTLAQMETLRDAMYPLQLANIRRQLEVLHRRAQRNEETALRLRTEILRAENGRKAFTGYLDGLKNDKVMAIKEEAEKAVKAAIEGDPALKASHGEAFEKLAAIATETKDVLQKIMNGEGSREELVGRYRELAQAEATAAKSIGEAFFAVYGTQIPPDATFTLRISDGVVKGYPMNGTVAPFFTSLYGLFARNVEFGNQDPFDLPQKWLDLEKAGKLDLSTPFCLVSTNDIIGGNSGSPLIDQNQNIVGLIFDGNIESLGNRFVFTEDVPRSVSVHPGIIIHSLRAVYDANDIADEIEGKSPGYK